MSAGVVNDFAPDAKLTRLERKLILAAEKGEDYVPTAADLASGEAIRGGLLRAMMMGTPLKHHPANRLLQAPRPVRLTAHGIRIKGPAPPERTTEGKDGKSAGRRAQGYAALVRIAGVVDLSGLRSGDGGALPPLEACGCRFEDALILAKARFHSLTLRHCRFSSLQANGARFDGDVAIFDCGPRIGSTDHDERQFMGRELVASRRDGSLQLQNRGSGDLSDGQTGCRASACWPKGHASHPECGLCCAVDLGSAVIAGGLQIVKTCLRGPGTLPQDPAPGSPPLCAIDLSHIEVRHRIEFVRCTLIGAANFISARVEDDVWIAGGKFLSHARLSAFNFQLANIGGVLAFQAEGATEDERKEGIRAFPVVVVGRISAISLQAGEVWVGEGFYFATDSDGWGAFPTVNLAKADIGRSFKVGAYHEHHVLDRHVPTGIARVHGEICTVAANIGKNLEVHGVTSQGFKTTLEFSNNFWRQLGIPPEPAECLRLTGEGVKVDRRVHISHGRFHECEPAEMPCRARTGPGASLCSERKPAAIDLFKSTIGTGFKIGHHATCKGAIRLNSCVIGREVIIRCRTIETSARDLGRAGDIPLMLDISESTIRGHMKIGRREPKPNPETGKPEEVAVRVEGAISLKSTNVQGSLVLGHVTLDLEDFPAPPVDDQAAATKGAGMAPAAAGGPPTASAQQAAAAAGETGECAAVLAEEEDQADRRKPDRVALNLRDCICGSDLEVHGMAWKLPKKEDDPKADPPAAPALRTALDRFYAGRFRSISRGTHAIVDLRGLQCGLLKDGFGGEWGLIYRIQLRAAGIVIKGVEPACHDPPHARPSEEGDDGRRDVDKWPPSKMARKAPIARLRWLSFQSRKQKIMPDVYETPKKSPLEPPKFWDWWHTFWERHQCSRQDDFVPQAYEAFSTAYRQAGEDRIAQEILVEKKNYENALRFRRIAYLWNSPLLDHVKIGIILTLVLLVGLSWWSGFAPYNQADMMWSVAGALAVVLVVLLWPYFVALFHIIFWSGFRYGLSPSRALAIFAVCIFAGWACVHYARNGAIAATTDWEERIHGGRLDSAVALVLDVEQEPSVRQRNFDGGDVGLSLPIGPSKDARSQGTRIEGRAIYAQASPCNLNVSSLVYALDVFIPLIDLDQERRCGIRDALAGEAYDRYFGWRLAKAFYELLGWIITSLVILTITGVLRRDLER